MKQWHYAKGGQKFGPFQKSKLEELYNQGDLAPTDLVWEEGSPNWVPAQSVLTPSTSASAGAAEPLSVSGEFRVFDCVERGWRLVWQHPAELIGGVFIAQMIAGLVQMPMQIGPRLWMFENKPSIPLFITGASLYLLGIVLTLLLTPAINGGKLWLLLKTLRERKPNLMDLFVAFKNFRLWLKLIGANLLVGIICAIIPLLYVLACVLAVFLIYGLPPTSGLNSAQLLGMFFGLFIATIPAIYFGVSYMFTFVALIDRQRGVWDAMEHSRKLVAGHWWPLLGLALLCGLLNLLGMLACCVGVIISAPVTVAALVFAYETLQTGREKKS